MGEERLRRRLAAILAADVVEYSRLMGADEARTLARLKALRRELIDPITAAYSGRIVKLMGDGALVEFASAVDAVACAIEIQRQVRESPTGGANANPIKFRMGIHVGDIIIDSDDIYGDGVNIAARLEGIAESGGIALSEDARRQVQGKVAAEFIDLGEQNLKNIASPVRVYRVAFGEQGASHPTAPRLSLPDKPSIAVLPFQNMSGDAEQDYFVDGMVEDIITGLSRIKWLFVIARNSSFIYKGRVIDVKQVGRELGVRYVLEGSVRKAASRVRITTQLVETENGRHIWGERYDRELTEIFPLQDEITANVVAAIEPSMRQAEIERVKRKRPESLDAYDLTLRALPLAYAAMPDTASKAIPLIERALRIEPDYALAHGLAAFCHENLFVRAGMREENRVAAIHHAHAAIAHGLDDAVALSFGGFIIGMVEHDRAAARAAFDSALALSPSLALTYMLGSVIMGWAGEAERAIEWGEHALRLSPLDPWEHAACTGMALGHFHLGHDEEAANAARRALHFAPKFSVCHMMLAAPLARLGLIAEARAAAARVIELQPSFTISRQCSAVGAVPAVARRLTEALRVAGLPP